MFMSNYFRGNGLSTRVSIRQKIMDYRSRYANKPLIIIDLMYYDQLGGYLHRSGDQTKMNDLCGISRQRVQQLENFVASLKGWGAELLFITNGPYLDVSGQILPDEDEAKVSSKDWRYELQCAIIDYLDRAHYSQVAADSNFIPIERVWTESVQKIARKYGKIMRAWDNTRHQEIAKYASVHDALAIISKNYALLLYSGLAFPKYKLWSLVDCASYKMETVEFDPLAIRRTLGLSTKQLRVLGAICDWYFNTSSFCTFLERIKVPNDRRTLFRDLATYVKKTAGNLQELDYLKIARDFFGEQKYLDKFDDFKTVCESYNINKITLSVDQNNDSISMQLKKQDSFNYDIYHGILFTCSITFVDYRFWQQHGVDFYEIATNLYQRISGVILQHKNDQSLVRYVKIKRSHTEPYTMAELKPQYPKNLHIPSLDYIFSLAGLTLMAIPDFNIRVLEFVTGMTLNRCALEFFCKTDQRSHLQDSVTLCFMVKLNMMDRFEADIMLMVIHKCRRERVQNVELPENLHLRAFHLYFTYVKMRTFVKHSFYCAGLDDSFMDENYLDGAIYQRMFQRWTIEGETEEFSREINRIEHYRLY
ncbi:uncharacterized protein LOC131692955 [Topomyia yanbarensis]|uniref:uncharacterized protein LOC131692955 n=1 Tax=Topomyia yanbarensis TaxID=2498891 RepID=UPI00273B4D3E|nr:uncharacterized protein LOC131692955 [Topomyia yanbarensis]